MPRSCRSNGTRRWLTSQTSSTPSACCKWRELWCGTNPRRFEAGQRLSAMAAQASTVLVGAPGFSHVWHSAAAASVPHHQLSDAGPGCGRRTWTTCRMRSPSPTSCWDLLLSGRPVHRLTPSSGNQCVLLLDHLRRVSLLAVASDFNGPGTKIARRDPTARNATLGFRSVLPSISEELPAERPAELTTSAAACLSFCALAEAQAVSAAFLPSCESLSICSSCLNVFLRASARCVASRRSISASTPR